MAVKVWTAVPVDGDGSAVQLTVSAFGEECRVGKFVSWDWQLLGVVRYLDHAADAWVAREAASTERRMVALADEVGRAAPGRHAQGAQVGFRDGRNFWFWSASGISRMNVVPLTKETPLSAAKAALARRMSRTHPSTLPPPLPLEEDRAVHGGDVYDPLRGVFTSSLEMMPMELPMGIGKLEGWPPEAALAELWARATRTNIAHTGILSALAYPRGAQLRLWQIEALVELLPQGCPARGAMRAVAVEARLLVLERQLPG